MRAERSWKESATSVSRQGDLEAKNRRRRERAADSRKSGGRGSKGGSIASDSEYTGASASFIGGESMATASFIGGASIATRETGIVTEATTKMEEKEDEAPPPPAAPQNNTEPQNSTEAEEAVKEAVKELEKSAAGQESVVQI